MNATLLKKEEMPADEFPWGSLQWFARNSLGNPAITLGFCRIKPGLENAPHYHPNCDETLHVLSGKIIHRVDGHEVEMNAGDTINIPANVPHNAKNIGAETAVLSIAFTTGDRQTVGGCQ